MLDYFIEEVLFVTKYITNEPMDDGVLYVSYCIVRISSIVSWE